MKTETTSLPAIHNTLIEYRRQDGSRGSSIVVDGLVASDVAHYEAQGYEITLVDRRGYCGHCKGTGSVRKSIRHQLRTCPVCKGAAEWDANEVRS